MSVLVVAEHIRGQVRDVTRELITAGRGLGPVTVAVIARDPAALVDPGGTGMAAHRRPEPVTRDARA